jgi:hypothetical protein
MTLRDQPVRFAASTSGKRQGKRKKEKIESPSDRLVDKIGINDAEVRSAYFWKL